MIPEIHLGGMVRYPESSTKGLVNTPLKLQVWESCGKHTVFQVTHQGAALYASKSLRSYAPLILDIQGNGGTRRWYGYVDSVKEDYHPELGKTSVVTGVGTTYPMKNASETVFTGLVEAERSLIKSSGLRYIVKGPTSTKPVVMGGRSKWQVLRDLSEEYGQYLFTIGTTVHALRAKDVMDMFHMEAVKLKWGGSSRDDTWNLTHFVPVLTDNVKDAKVAYSSNQYTGAVTRVSSGNSIFTSFPKYSSHHVENQMSAENVLETATASAPGHTKIYAGKPIYLENAKPGPWWIVDSVEHTFDSKENSYTVNMCLERSRSVIEYPPGHVGPRKNPFRESDDGKRLNREEEPRLSITRSLVSGSVSSLNNVRWKPR